MFEVTETCPHCEAENTMIWNTHMDGFKAFCPHCGEKMMLCSVCPYRMECDWDKDSCRAARLYRYEVVCDSICGKVKFFTVGETLEEAAANAKILAEEYSKESKIRLLVISVALAK